ncbi:MAG: aldehyde ferredoxin oxidoreductase family protein [bacterium]|nr:aldehyde ferredoxin oxidoreductase family protein [bacterium]
MHGNWGKISLVNLSSREIKDWVIEEAPYRNFLGGAGLGAYLFFKLKGYAAEPFAPENPLLFLNGPLSGTTLPGTSRLEICARSPLTRIWGEASMGGQVSPELKRSGYDGIVFTGIAPGPVYLFLSDGQAELRDASHLWGKDNYETEACLRQETGDQAAKVISIGPAGENLVRFAGIVNDKGSLAARSGLGAVMGSKKLKAVVIRGRLKYSVADEVRLKKIRAEAREMLKNDIFAFGLQAFGTGGGVGISSAISDMPVQNWRQARWPEGMRELSGTNIAKVLSTKRHACYACPIACKRIVEIPEGKYRMPPGPGPEYEAISSLGSLLRIDNVQAVVKANQLCNAYGMDAISTGGVIAYAIEAFQNGCLTLKDTDNLALDWDQPDQLITLIHKIAGREGFGNELAEGCRRLSEKYGGREFAMQVKGMEVPMHDPRTLWSLALSYATSIRGACHNRDTNLGLEMGLENLETIGKPRTKPYTKDGKAMQTIHAQAMGSLADSAVMCVFAWKGMHSSLDILREMLNAVTGLDYTNEELLRIGDRTWYLKRAIGNLCGATREDDQVPARIIAPYLEGRAGGLLKVVNLLINLDKLILPKIKSERLIRYYKKLNEKVIIPKSFATITGLGKLFPSIRRLHRRIRNKNPQALSNERVDLDFMLNDYYALRKINLQGFPEKEILENLGLGEVSAVLYAEELNSF